MSVEQARFNMVEQQIRTWEVLDQDVLDLCTWCAARIRTRRVPAFAFSDLEIPLYEGATKRAHDAAQARSAHPSGIGSEENDRALEVGTGSGYLAALLAARAHCVCSVEINPRLKAFGEENLRRAGVENVRVELGDAARGWPQHCAL